MIFFSIYIINVSIQEQKKKSNKNVKNIDA